MANRFEKQLVEKGVKSDVATNVEQAIRRHTEYLNAMNGLHMRGFALLADQRNTDNGVVITEYILLDHNTGKEYRVNI